MKRIITFILVVVLAVSSLPFALGCGGTKYSVKVNNDNEKGAVVGVVDGQEFNENTELNITVTSVIGYVISNVKWNKEKITLSSNKSVSFAKTITEDSTLQITYAVDPNIEDQYLLSADVSETTTPDVEIDFGAYDTTKVNNVKKIDIFSPVHSLRDTSVSPVKVNEQTKAILPYLKDFTFDAFRSDFNVNYVMTNELKNGDWSDPDKTLAHIYDLSDNLNANNTLLQLILLQNPNYVWGEAQNNVKMPDMQKYTEYMETLSREIKKSGRRVLYETWNEPDLVNWADSYWSDGAKNFIDMSTQGAVALKKGDPDAYVVEMGLCYPVRFVQDYWDYYMDKCAELGHNPDCFAWHYYGDAFGNITNTVSETEDFNYWKNAIRNKINRYNDSHDLHTMTQYVSEFHPTANGGRASDVAVDAAIPKAFSAIETLLESTDIAKASWVSFYMTTDMSIISTDGQVKTPMYYVLWAYSRLPIMNAKVDVKNAENVSDFSIRSGVDSKRASALITNNVMNPGYIAQDTYVQRVEDSRIVNVKLKNIPSSAQSFRIHLIDAVHTTGVNQSGIPYLVKNVDMTNVLNGQVTLTLKIPGNASFYIEIDDGTGESEISSLSNLYNNLAKRDLYYDERADLMPYSDVYERACNVTMGMLNHQTGKTATCLTFNDMQGYDYVSTNWKINGNFNTGTNQGYGVRVDYHTASGYTYSKTYRVGDGNFTYARFGTGRVSDAYGDLINTDGIFDIPIKSDAPQGWDGKIQMTFFMKDAGANTSVNVSLSGK